VNPTSGPYNEQVIIPAIGGASAVNTITFNGNGRTVSDNGAAVTAQRAVFKLDGADYVTMNNFIINTGAGTYGYGVQMLNDADNNTVSNCTINTNNSSTSTTNYAGVLINSTASAITTAGASLCDNNTVSGNTINGGLAGVAIVGNTTTSQVFGNRVLNNTITDFYNYGIYINGNVGTLIEGNDISRPLRSTVTIFYGVFFTTISTNTIVNKNKFHDPFAGNPASTAAAYAVDHVNCDATAGNENIVSNNLVYNFNGGTGTQNGFLCNASDYVIYYHNTIALEDVTATCTTCGTRGFYQQGTATGLTYRNNIVTIKRGGTGDKQGIFFEQATLTGITLSNNDYYFYPGPGGLQEIGHIGLTGGTGYTTIAAWQAGTGQEAGSVSADPVYLNTVTGDYHPTAASVNNLGTPVGILTDITGAARSVTTPDIGAYEFNVAAGVNMGAEALITPAVATNDCYTNSEIVSIRIRNSSAATIDFAVNPVTVTTNVTGAVVQTLGAVVNSGTLVSGATMDVAMTVPLNMGATGVYTFNAFTSVAGDTNPANDAMAPATRTKGILAAGTASSNSGPYCITGGAPTLATTGAGGYGLLQWQQSTTSGSGFTNIPGANTSPYTVGAPITQTMYYRAQASCNGTTVTSNEISIVLNNPQITGTTPGSTCGPGTVTLSATGSGNTTFRWYDVPTGGVPVGTGSPFTTPVINNTTTYYAVAGTGSGGSASLGLPAELAGTSGAGTTNFGLVFDALSAFTLNTVTIYPISATAGLAGTVTIDVVNSTGAVVHTATVNVVGNPTASATAQTVTLNFTIAPGTNYKLRPGSRSAGITGLLFEPSASAPPGGNYGYPFTLPGVVSITHSTLTAPPTNTVRLDLYYYFYNWQIATGCESARTPVVATVNTPPSATITYTGSPYCSSTGTATVTITGAAGGVYSSTAGLSIDPVTGTINLGASTPGTYTVTYTIAAAGGCAQFQATTLFMFGVPPSATITYTGSPYCANTGIASVTITGTAGGVYSSTAGLSIDPATGAINMSISTAGTYTVTYTIAANGACPQFQATTQFVLNAPPSATITYSGSPYCNTGTGSVTRTGTAGGVYSSTAGLSIDPATGAINLVASTQGTYTVTYSIAAAGGCPAFSTTTSVTIQSVSTAATAASSSSTTNCGATTVNLSISGGSLGAGASWRWYSGSCGGTAVGTGATLSNVPVNATTTFYVRAEGSCNTTACASVTVTINTQRLFLFRLLPTQA